MAIRAVRVITRNEFPRLRRRGNTNLPARDGNPTPTIAPDISSRVARPVGVAVAQARTAHD